MDTQTQIDRLIELAIIQRSELKQLVEQLPQLREHLNAEVEKVFDETEPQLRAELEEWTTKQTADKTAALGVALEAKIAELAKSLEVSTQARYNAIIAEREENARLAAQAEAKIAEHAASLPSAVKEIVSAELARFPRAGEIDQLRKEFAEPRGLNPRGKWQAGESYSKLDFVTINGDSYASNIDNNRTRPSRSSADWTLVAARGTGGGGGPTSLSELTTVPSDGDLLIGSGTSWVTSNLTAGAGISITVGPGAITISATDGDITLDDGTAASPSLHFTNDADTGIYRPAANTLGISVSGTQVAYFDENGLTVPSAGVVAGGSIHAGNGNANNPSLSFNGDQDTGFFRHQPNEIGIALGGTQYATLTSTTFSITPVVTMASSLRVNGTTDSSSKDTGAIVTEGGLGVEKSASIGGNLTVSGGTLAVTPSANDATATLKGRATGTNQLATSSRGSNVTLVNLDTTDNNCEAIAFQNSNELAIASIVAQNVSHTGRTGKLYVNISNGAAPAEALNIAADKTVTLSGNLTVSGTGTSSFAGPLKLTYGTNLTGTDIGLFATSGGGLYINAPTTKNIRLGFNLGDRMTLDENTATFATNLTVSGGTITSGSGTLTLNSSANTVVLQSAGTTALTLDSSQHFKLTPAAASSIITTQSAPQIRMGSRASGRSNIVLDSTAGRVWSLENTGTSLTVGYSGLDAITIAETTGNATFAGRIRVSGFDSTYYNANAALIGNATYNPKLALASTLGYTWTARTNDVGGAGEFIVRYEEGSKDFLTIDRNGNTVVNSAAIATNATNGFLYVPSCAGTPTGTPTTYTGRVPIVVDTTNNKLYFYSSGAWRDAGP